MMMKLMPVWALALQALGREDKALEVIGRCLTIAEPEDFVRIFVEHGSPMLSLLQAAAKCGIQTEYITHLIPAFNTGEAPQAHAIPKAQPKDQAQALLEPLSQREIQGFACWTAR
jgi:LuxR family maltose regulon positive regulatory protein